MVLFSDLFTAGKNTTFVAIFCLFSVVLWGQLVETPDLPIVINGETQTMGLAGGMNMPQFSQSDLNQDGTDDLFVFDREGNAMSAFKASGGNYVYAPSLLQYFPRLNAWALLYDYNQDGAADIFAFTSQSGIAGIEVHKGHWMGTHLAFDKLTFGQPFDVLYYQGSGGTPVNLYVSKVDIPALSDVDGDGDMDILTFASNGGYVEYYRNYSQENGFGADTLIFKKEDYCWGKFYESGVTSAITLSSDPDECATPLTGPSAGQNRHIGSTVLAMDTDEDGDKDLLLGDVSYNNIVWLLNDGTPSKAFMTDQDTLFPMNHPVNIPYFPASFSMDYDGDGRGDLVFVPNTKTGLDIGNVWLYQNHGPTANPQFTFVKNDFLAGEMLDNGTGCYPAIADINMDGLPDWVVGNQSRTGGDSRLRLYLNVGTATQPKFELTDDNYLQLPQTFPDLWDFRPVFGDLDGDGDLDLMVGENGGGLIYFENVAGAGSPVSFTAPVYPYKEIDVGLAAAPFIVDADQDGLNDLIIGERNGNVNFLKNIGTAGNPDFQSDHQSAPNNPFWGHVDVRKIGHVTGYSVPRMFKVNGVYQLIVGSESGRLHVYKDIESNLSGEFTKVTGDYGGLHAGGIVYPAFADLNQSGHKDLLLGNSRGGLTAYSTPFVTGTSKALLTQNDRLTVYPNPSTGSISLQFDAVRGDLKVMNLSGQIVAEKRVTNREIISLSHLPAGMYMLQVLTGEKIYSGQMALIK